MTCSGHEHKVDLVYLDEVFHLNVDQLFQLLFTDSEFYRHFLQLRKTFGACVCVCVRVRTGNTETVRNIRREMHLEVTTSAERDLFVKTCSLDHQPPEWCFSRTFSCSRFPADLVQAPWPEETDENGEKKREIGYTLSLNYSIGPKSTQSTEKQVRQFKARDLEDWLRR